MSPLRMAQYGTKHGHADGKLIAMLASPDVDFAGVYEPDLDRRQALAAEDGPFRDARWFDSPEQMLADDSIVAVASEGSNAESLAQTEAILRAGRHVWYDKPAGDDWPRWLEVAELAQERQLLIQMGYMFRYHRAFAKVADLARSGALGQVFSIRAHMSTWITHEQREKISVHRGGILYDLGAHMLDQFVRIMGRPAQITSFLRNDATPDLPSFADNTLSVLEYESGLAVVDIAAMEPQPLARRYEVYGTKGSAIILEHFETARQIRLVLEKPAEGYAAGEHVLDVPYQSRQDLYDLELAAFLATIQGRQRPDRSLSHESLVQETLLRAVGLLE
jgi:predicted dehydrogenase